MYICSIWVRLYVSDKNSVFADWSKWKGNAYQWKYDVENVLSVVRIRQMNKVHLMSYLLVYKLFELAVEWNPAIRNKTETILISKNHLHAAMAEKKIISVFCVSVVLHFPHQSAVQIKLVSSAWLYFLLKSTTEEKKS